MVLLITLIVVKVKLPDSSILGIGVLINVILFLSLVAQYRLKQLVLNTNDKTLAIELDKWFFLVRKLVLPLSGVEIYIQRRT